MEVLMYVEKVQKSTMGYPRLLDSETAIYQGWIMNIPFNEKTNDWDFSDFRKLESEGCPRNVLKRLAVSIIGYFPFV